MKWCNYFNDKCENTREVMGFKQFCETGECESCEECELYEELEFPSCYSHEKHLILCEGKSEEKCINCNFNKYEVMPEELLEELLETE